MFDALYTIPLVDLPLGNTLLHYPITDSFFASLDFSPLQKADLKSTLNINKHSDTVFFAQLHIEGTLTLPCDYCLEPVDFPFAHSEALSIERSEAITEMPDHPLDPWQIPLSCDALNVGIWLYEAICSALPLKRAHNYHCNPYIQKEEEKNSPNIDQRWDNLKRFL